MFTPTHPTFVSTWPDRFRTLFSAVSTAASITAPSATTTEPTGDGVFSMVDQSVAFNSAAVLFYGGNDNNQTFTARITGWRKYNTLWIPVPLLALSGTLGAMTGVAGTGIVAAQLFADTLTASTAFTGFYEIISPGNDQVATVKVDAFGCEKIHVQVAIGTCDNIAALAAGF